MVKNQNPINAEMKLNPKILRAKAAFFEVTAEELPVSIREGEINNSVQQFPVK